MKVLYRPPSLHYRSCPYQDDGRIRQRPQHARKKVPWQCQFLLHRGDTAPSLAPSLSGAEKTYGIEVPCGIATNIEILHESNAQIPANQRTTARNHEIQYVQIFLILLNGVSNLLSTTDSFSDPALQSIFEVQSLRFVAQLPTHLKGQSGALRRGKLLVGHVHDGYPLGIRDRATIPFKVRVPHTTKTWAALSVGNNVKKEHRTCPQRR